MLEYHSRLHHLDVKRQKQQQRKQEAAAAAAAYHSSSRSSSSNNTTGPFAVQHPVLKEAPSGTAAGAAAAAGVQHSEAEGFALEHDSAEQLEEGCCNDAASDVQVRHELITRHVLRVCACPSCIT
jgi:hypothetical protein